MPDECLSPATLPRYFGSVGYYAMVAACGGAAAMDAGLRFDKRQKAAHRCTIADTRGPLTLTVPIAKPPTSRVAWGDIRVSTHGAWWDVHLTALESAYGRTPYFEFYIDRFMPVFRPRTSSDCEAITALDGFIDKEVRKILGFADSLRAESGEPQSGEWVGGESDFNLARHPYYQIRADRLGFIPGLSVLDLIFNMGPESQLVIDEILNDKPQQ